jgi:hypothetical protein
MNEVSGLSCAGQLGVLSKNRNRARGRPAMAKKTEDYLLEKTVIYDHNVTHLRWICEKSFDERTIANHERE